MHIGRMTAFFVIQKNYNNDDIDQGFFPIKVVIADFRYISEEVPTRSFDRWNIKCEGRNGPAVS